MNTDKRLLVLFAGTNLVENIMDNLLVKVARVSSNDLSGGIWPTNVEEVAIVPLTNITVINASTAGLKSVSKWA
jgi:hypothetical protein